MKSDQGSLQDIIEIFSSQQLAQKNKNKKKKRGAGNTLTEPKAKQSTIKSSKIGILIKIFVGFFRKYLLWKFGLN